MAFEMDSFFDRFSFIPWKSANVSMRKKINYINIKKYNKLHNARNIYTHINIRTNLFKNQCRVFREVQKCNLKEYINYRKFRTLRIRTFKFRTKVQ